MVNKVKIQDVSKSIDKVVEDTRRLIKSNGFTDDKKAEEGVEKFLISKQLKKVACTCRTDSTNRSYYVQFSFDDCIIENATIRSRSR